MLIAHIPATPPSPRASAPGRTRTPSRCVRAEAPPSRTRLHAPPRSRAPRALKAVTTTSNHSAAAINQRQQAFTIGAKHSPSASSIHHRRQTSLSCGSGNQPPAASKQSAAATCPRISVLTHVGMTPSHTSPRRSRGRGPLLYPCIPHTNVTQLPLLQPCIPHTNVTHLYSIYMHKSPRRCTGRAPLQ